MKLAQIVGKKLQVIRSQMEMKERRSRLEEVARQLGADLADPEDYRVCQELAAKAA